MSTDPTQIVHQNDNPPHGEELIPVSMDEQLQNIGADESNIEEEEGDEVEYEQVEGTGPGGSTTRPRKIKRKRRIAKSDAVELRLLGRRASCKRIPDIAPLMFNLVKRRVLSSYSDELRGLDEEQMTELIKKDATKLADRSRVIDALKMPDEVFDRGQVQEVILNILMQEETYSIDENRLYERVNEFEKYLVKSAKGIDFDELKKQDPDRWHHFDTYRIVLDAAWSATMQFLLTRQDCSPCLEVISVFQWKNTGR